MTFCLTFDDGLKTHYRVAAPLLEANGWRGVFAVPTGIVSAGRANVRQAEDLCIVGNETNVMSWDEVNDLICRGHTVCPHTQTHVDLATLECAGRFDEIEREIADSKAEFVERTNVVPKLFCLPHCTGGSVVADLVRKHGMEPINGHGKWRVNFGECSGDGNSYSDITAFIRRYYYLGFTHLDIMIHGLVRAEGGWMPFDDAVAFESFLKAIKAEEDCGRVRVVDYMCARRRPSRVRELYFKFYRHLPWSPKWK